MNTRGSLDMHSFLQGGDSSRIGTMFDKTQQQPHSQLQQQTEDAELKISTPVGNNVSKVKWLTTEEPLVPDAFATEYFIVGTYGNAKNNDVSLWKLSTTNFGSENRAKTTQLHKTTLNGHITGLVVLDNDNFALTTSGGVMSIFKLLKGNSAGGSAKGPHAFNLIDTRQLHSMHRQFPCPATDIASNDPGTVVSVGEDGSIFEYNVRAREIVRSLEKVDPLSISVVKYIGRSEIVTGNGGGQLKLWDLRSPSTQPRIVLNPNVLMNNLTGVSSIAQYPSQSFVLFAGYQSGCMDLWDIRKGSGATPTANLVGQGTGAVSDIQFHHINPDHFFTCNQEGAVSHWAPSDEEDMDLRLSNLDTFADLNIEFLRRGLSYFDVYSSPFPVNSISISQNDRLICGGDSGIVHVTEITGV